MKEDLSNLKIGDKVYSLLYGWGVVENFLEDRISTRGENKEKRTYSQEGKYTTAIPNQVLFTYNPFEKINEFPKWMEIKYPKEWIKKYVVYKNPIYNSFLFFDDENCVSTPFWTVEVREIQPSIEMSIKEIEEKLGITNLKIIDK